MESTTREKRSAMKIDIVSIFPDYLDPLRLSLVGKAIDTGIVELSVHDLREWTHDRHRTVDDTPYGGGAGMVMKPEPWGEVLDQLVPSDPAPASSGSAPVLSRPELAPSRPESPPSRPELVEGQAAVTEASPLPLLIILTPSGRTFTQQIAHELAAAPQLIFACGRYEGIDSRVAEYAASRMRVDELSIGDYVLNGGEAAALVIIEAVVRLLPGVIGNPASLAEESHGVDHDGLLEYPAYTKPPSWRGLEVPQILFSGHHGKIAEWRRAKALAKTRDRRPDLVPDALSEIVVTPAQPDDAGELLVLQRAAYLSEARAHGTFDIPPLTESVAELSQSLTTGTVLLARRAGRLIGSVRGEPRTDGEWYVGRLMVAPDLQNQGVGRLLMDRIESLAPAGTRFFGLFTGALSGKSLSFYRKRGYLEVKRVAHPGYEAVFLEKQLPG